MGRGRLFEHEQETVILLRQHAVMVTLWFNRSAIKVSRVGVGWAGCLFSRGRGGMAVGFNLFFSFFFHVIPCFHFAFLSRNAFYPTCIKVQRVLTRWSASSTIGKVESQVALRYYEMVERTVIM